MVSGGDNSADKRVNGGRVIDSLHADGVNSDDTVRIQSSVSEDMSTGSHAVFGNSAAPTKVSSQTTVKVIDAFQPSQNSSAAAATVSVASVHASVGVNNSFYAGGTTRRGQGPDPFYPPIYARQGFLLPPQLMAGISAAVKVAGGSGASAKSRGSSDLQPETRTAHNSSASLIASTLENSGGNGSIIGGAPSGGGCSYPNRKNNQLPKAVYNRAGGW
jgi:hypothetical protein